MYGSTSVTESVTESVYQGTTLRGFYSLLRIANKTCGADPVRGGGGNRPVGGQGADVVPPLRHKSRYQTESFSGVRTCSHKIHNPAYPGTFDL